MLQERKINGIKIEKEEAKPSLFTENTSIYIENPFESPD